jgi:hypothetical protein
MIRTARGAEAIGSMLGYAWTTDTRMLALVGDPKADVYEVLFFFSSQENKAEFLCLLQANDATACEEEEIMVPHPEEIKAAQPIAEVLPGDVLREVLAIAPNAFQWRFFADSVGECAPLSPSRSCNGHRCP